MKLTSDIIKQIMPNLPASKRSLYLPPLQSAMGEFDINTRLRAAAFLAQIAHESAELKYMEEIASGAAYEGRKNLGNTQKGDGKRFKGRGPIQLTGRANYRKYGNLLGVDLEDQPELAATPEIAFRIAGQYWEIKNLNDLADKRQFKAITYRINGGYNGIDERLKYYNRALRVIPEDFNLGDDETANEFHLNHENHTANIEDENKGVSTNSDIKKEDMEGVTPPTPAIEIKASEPSLLSKLTALGMPVGAGSIIIGIKTFVAGISPWGWAIIGALFVVMTIVGAWLYNESMKRAAGRTSTASAAAADPNKNNIRYI